MNDLIFQKAELSDSKAILALLKRISVWLEEKGVNQWRQFLDEKKGMAIVERRFREGDVYKITLDGSLLGVFVIQLDDPFWHSIRKDDLARWIHTMGIDPSLMGKGIGNKILSYIEKNAISARKKFVRLDCYDDNKRLCIYYESNGFNYTGSKSWEERIVRLYEKAL